MKLQETTWTTPNPPPGGIRAALGAPVPLFICAFGRVAVYQNSGWLAMNGKSMATVLSFRYALGFSVGSSPEIAVLLRPQRTLHGRCEGTQLPPERLRCAVPWISRRRSR